MTYLKPNQSNKGCSSPDALLTNPCTITSQSLGPQVEHMQVYGYLKPLEKQDYR